MNRVKANPIMQALLAAFLFGASAPLSKLLLGDIEPILLAGFLYLGSGIGLLLFKMTQNLFRKSVEVEARLQKTDVGWLAGAVLAGGVAAPIVLLFGLKSTPGATASLLLNFESVATTLIAAWVFKEQVSRKAWWAILCIMLAGTLLTINVHERWGISFGAIGVLAACVLWGIDNNFTRNISAMDPIMIVMIKGLAAGSFSLMLAIVLGNQLPIFGVALKAMLLGSLSYGASIILFIRAMRGLGAARTSALFGTAPMAGMALSYIFLRESPTLILLAVLPLMIVGTILLLNEKHSHIHTHEPMIHEHSHSHQDGLHLHVHEITIIGTHSHIHEHTLLEHEHVHTPDIVHRHMHSTE
jgi:drug/metabolite transporter (DMT)-like permease